MFWSSCILAQAPLDWVQTFGNDGTNQHDELHDMAIDGQGNIYVTATIVNASSGNPWPAPSYGSIDIIIMKLDAGGNTIWVKQIGGPSADSGGTFPFYHLTRTWISIVKDEYLIISGIAGAECDLDPGTGTFLTSSGGNQPFIMRMEVDGDFTWAKFWESQEDVTFEWQMTTDTSGGIYMALDYSPSLVDSIDVNPFPGQEVWLSVNDYPGDRTGVIVKFSLDGDFEWFGVLPGWSDELNISSGSSNDIDRPLTSYKEGILTSRCFDGERIIALPNDTVHLSSQSGCEPFLASITSDGTLDWYGQFGGDSLHSVVNAMSHDEGDNVFLFGTSYRSDDLIDIDPGTDVDMQIFKRGVFAMKLNDGGNLVWYSSVVNSLSPLTNVVVNENGVVGTGYFYQTMSVSTLNGVVDMTGGTSHPDEYMVMLDSSGTVHWAGEYDTGGTAYYSAWMPVRNHINGGLLVGGTFEGEVDLNPNSQVNLYTSSGGYDVFVERLEFPPITVVEETMGAEGFGIYPNPTSGHVIVSTKQNRLSKVLLFDMLGKHLLSYSINGKQQIELDLNGYQSGVYLVEVESEDGGKEVRRLVIQR